MRLPALVTCVLLAVAGCGDNLGGTPPIDAGIDAPACPARALGQVGGPCTMDDQCESAPGAGDGVCLDAALGGIGWPAEGYCINKIDLMSADCSGGCETDGDGGDGNVCVSVGGCNACVAACCEGNACPDGQVCASSLVGESLGQSACLPGVVNGRDGAPCMGFSGCAVGSICFADPFENPGGYCSTVGTIGDDATCANRDDGDGHCIALDTVTAGTGCVDACASDAECRMADGYRCFDGGGGSGRYCRHPQTGDACAVDTDCGAAGVWQCRTGAPYPGGYCTPIPQCNAQTGAGCTPGSSVCFDPVGVDTPYCVDRCTGVGQGTCRTGYLCAMVGSARGCVPVTP